ncbi:MAG: hypothetical protein R3C14_42850 [Caldilineaceae bacterium]
MQSLETIKSKGQESLHRLVDLGKSQPEDVQLWGVTGGAAVAGALAVTAVAKGVLAIVATLANPPVALTVGAVAGGFAGWSFMQKAKPVAEEAAEAAPAAESGSIADLGQSQAPAMSGA